MTDHPWTKAFPGSILVCDPDGVILEMNDRAAKTYEADGGYALIGKNLLDCHPEQARLKLERLLASRQANVYTIEKSGVHKLIYQTPWYENGEFRGLVELSLVIPEEMPHFVRS